MQVDYIGRNRTSKTEIPPSLSNGLLGDSIKHASGKQQATEQSSRERAMIKAEKGLLTREALLATEEFIPTLDYSRHWITIDRGRTLDSLAPTPRTEAHRNLTQPGHLLQGSAV